MLVMRQLITDQLLMSPSHAAVGCCGKVGQPRHYLTRGQVEGKRRQRGEEGCRCLSHNSVKTDGSSGTNSNRCVVYGRWPDSTVSSASSCGSLRRRRRSVLSVLRDWETIGTEVLDTECLLLCGFILWLVGGHLTSNWSRKPPKKVSQSSKIWNTVCKNVIKIQSFFFSFSALNHYIKKHFQEQNNLILFFEP